MAKTPLMDVHALHPGRLNLYRRLHSTEEALIRKAMMRKKVVRSLRAAVRDKPGLGAAHQTEQTAAGEITLPASFG